MAAHRMTPARRAALRKAQIASARKRRKGIRGKVRSTVGNHRAKRSANKTLRNSAATRTRRANRSARLSKKATRTRLRSKAYAAKSQKLAGKSKKFQAKSLRVGAGKEATFGKKLKGAPARFKKARKRAKAHAARYNV